MGHNQITAGSSCKGTEIQVINKICYQYVVRAKWTCGVSGRREKNKQQINSITPSLFSGHAEDF